MKHKLLFAGLMLLLNLSLSAETYNGTCGDNLTWTLDTESGILTISGTGEMTNNYTPWYSNRSSITHISIALGVTNIGAGAFSGCSSLISVTIPNSVTDIKYNAFSGCCSLTSVTIPNSVTSVGQDAFSGCSSLTSVTIPNSVISIGSHAFTGCSSLTSITIPNSVTRIEYATFNGCSSLTSVTIPNSVTSIRKEAFSFCISLTAVTIPNSVTSIGENAFWNVPNIAYTGSATGSPWGARSVNGYVEGYLVYSDASKTTLLACSAAVTGEIVIPNSVTSIGNNAFFLCNGLTSVTIPNGVTSIGDYTFNGLSSLTSVTIPNSVTSIGENAFWNVPNIAYTGSATGSPWGARSVNGYVEGYLVYSDASKTTLLACSDAATGEIVLPNSVTSVGQNAFSGCSSLTSVTIPNSVISIGSHAFTGCSSLTSVSIPNSVISIGDYAFTSCSSLTSVSIPNSVISIGDYAFTGCSSLTSVTIPNSVTSIGNSAFCRCTSLNNVILGCSVKVLEEETFFGCEAIETITCYSMTPPIIKNDALKFVQYSTIVYVPSDSFDDYYNHEIWGLYDVRKISAETTQTDDVTVTSTETTADVVWPVVSDAATYELVISDTNGNLICTLTFNDKGQLTSMSFNTPARDNVPGNMQIAGFFFTVTGLEQGTTYHYTLTAKDADSNVLDTKTGSFTTNGITALDEKESTSTVQTRKMIRNGVLYILMPDGRKYDTHGTEVR